MSKVFSEKLRKLLFEKNLKQETFAKKIGVKQSHISNWITGRRNPSVKTLEKIAKVLDVPMSYLIEDTEEKDSNISVDKNFIYDLEKRLKNLEIKFLELENKVLKNEIKKKKNNNLI